MVSLQPGEQQLQAWHTANVQQQPVQLTVVVPAYNETRRCQ